MHFYQQQKCYIISYHIYLYKKDVSLQINVFIELHRYKLEIHLKNQKKKKKKSGKMTK